jgi:hypothetical protein
VSGEKNIKILPLIILMISGAQMHQGIWHFGNRIPLCEIMSWPIAVLVKNVNFVDERVTI